MRTRIRPMWTPADTDLTSLPKQELYSRLAADLEALLAGEQDFLANAANTAALLYHALPRVNWVGLYRWVHNQLVLGPFQGKPACVRIPPGQGVCGKAVRLRQTLIVPDVHAFPGHIACDPASRSEIVIPLITLQTLHGVWDIDSPDLQRFEEVDRFGLERLMNILLLASFGKPLSLGESPSTVPPPTSQA